MHRLLISLLLLLVLLPASVFALDVPKAKGYVNDHAGILKPATELKLEQFLREFESSDSTQIAILTIPSLQGEALEEYALKVAENWGIGRKGKDNGALLLIARDERKMRIEVGYGLEGRLTDLLSGRIIDNEIGPRFRKGDFDGGIVAGTLAMAEAVRGKYKGTGSRRRKKSDSPWKVLPFLIFFGPAMIGLFRPRSRYSAHRRGGVWIGGGPFTGGRGGFGGGGGGFGGFGGGGFGGGGASGGW